MRIVLMGPPGAGKGTQGALLSALLGVPHVSTGAMLRESAEAGHPAGLMARSLIDRGEFVPDATALEIVEGRLDAADARNGFILDGFPRTLEQARALDRLLHRRDEALDATVELTVDPSALLHRIEGRARVARERGESPRADDNAGTLMERLSIYAERTEPVVGHYEGTGRLVRVDGMGSPGPVTKSIMQSILDLGAVA